MVTDAEISNSVLFAKVKVDAETVIEHTVILPQVTIGKNCVIKRAVIDRHCTIPDGLEIGVNLEEDAKRFRVSKGGIVLVTQKMLDSLSGYQSSIKFHHTI